MNNISIFLKSKLEIHYLSKYDRSGKQKGWRARIRNKEGASVIVNYFDRFPMFSSKYLNYQDWCIVYNILLNKKHIGKNKLNIYNIFYFYLFHSLLFHFNFIIFILYSIISNIIIFIFYFIIYLLI